MQNREAATRRQVLLAVALTAPLLLGVVHICARTAGSVGCDFTAMYTSALTVRTGHGRERYDLEKQAALQQELFHRTGLMVDIHPPFEALLLAPLTRLSFARAYEVWGAINVALWMLFAYLIRPYVLAPKNTLPHIPLAFLFYPAWLAMFQGQTTFLVLVTYTLTFLCLKRGRDFWAGAFLGLGLFRFAVILPFALICLLRAKWKVMAGFALAALLLGAVSIMTVGFAGVLAYVHLLFDIARHSRNPALAAALRSWIMPTVRGFLDSVLAGYFSSGWINVIVALLSVFLLLFTARQWRRADRSGSGAEQNLMFAAALAVSLLTSLHLYTYDLTLMLPAILLVVGSTQWAERAGWRVIWIACLTIMYFPLVHPLLTKWHMLYALAPVLATFALATLLVASLPAQSPRADKLDAVFVPQGSSTETLSGRKT
jgi:hypothetical protein